MRINRFFIYLCASFMLFFAPFSWADATNERNKEAQQIYYDTLSPFCPGRSLADCPTEQAKDLKNKIQDELKTGKSKEEVYQWVLDTYGKHLRASPEMSGWNLVAWLAPLVILMIGLFIILARIRSGQQDPESQQD